MTTEHLLKEALHVLCAEGGFQSYHLVEDAAEGPYIRFHIVGLVSPDLWTCIVRGTRLSIEKALLRDFGDIHIA